MLFGNALCLFTLICINFSPTTAKNITNIFVSLANRVDLLEEELGFLKDVNVNYLPQRLRDIVRRTDYGEHMCCRNKPVRLITKSRSVRRISIEKDEIKTGSHSCGLVGSCNNYDYKYRQVIKYVTEYFKAINYATCPDRHVVCCYLYIMVAEKCVHLDDLHEVATQLLG